MSHPRTEIHEREGAREGTTLQSVTLWQYASRLSLVPQRLLEVPHESRFMASNLFMYVTAR